MFTGLVEELGTVFASSAEDPGQSLTISAPLLAVGAHVGDSIAVNGVCLSVSECSGANLSFQVGPETLRRTNLGSLAPAEHVNLERSLRLCDRLGGHLVQGHVDAVGQIASRRREGDWELVWFACPAELTSQMAPRGAIAVDGVSLTLVDVLADRFSVALIPLTLARTTLGFKSAGTLVNLETDVLAKYVARALTGPGATAGPPDEGILGSAVP